ncbi:MAG: DEAD/DEAH box helicase [Nanoarchaeota archaeon]|nr:DEAD/DEAH box helicase [Nanoarchaeota archaeon]MBU1029645.1 DEAD/DEAH box helicase [Nanoarchaeota archaeon]MBU1849185.1 DEAD/DEAH box helicase [Nanoarchaeota archaeon]
MLLEKFKDKIPKKVFSVLKNRGFETLRPAQYKSIKAGLFEDENLLVCTPTASGKTLVAELAILNAIFHDKGKAVYVVPLRALASEKFKDFKRHYGTYFKIAISSGDIDSADSYLEKYDLIITTSEKFDSLIRHKAHWISRVKVVILDEIHLLNDTSRGPTLEILITILRKLLKNLQIIGLSATIGNPEELASWLSAKLVEDKWRPVRLDKGVYFDGKIEFT